MRMTSLDNNSIEHLLRERPSTVAINGLWQFLHDELGVGETNGTEMTFSPEDFDRIRHWLRNDLGIDPLLNGLAGARIEVAGMRRFSR